VSGSMKLDLAQYREMAAFAQFGSGLDAATQKLLNRGARLTELLKQAQFSPMPFEEQTVSIFAGTNGYIDGVDVNRVNEYEASMLDFFRANHADILGEIRESKKFDGDVKDRTVAALDTFAKQFA
ncbi:MAG: F0F1 ATP synthase subunit alpha, partial [Pseudomonadota bacterium]